MEVNSSSLSPGIWWHLLFCQLRFKLDSSICDRNPEACVDPEDKGDCFNYFPWMAYLALTSAWGKILGARCMQPCNYAFKSIFLINLNMHEALSRLESENLWPGHWIESRLPDGRVDHIFHELLKNIFWWRKLKPQTFKAWRKFCSLFLFNFFLIKKTRLKNCRQQLQVWRMATAA